MFGREEVVESVEADEVDEEDAVGLPVEPIFAEAI